MLSLSNGDLGASHLIDNVLLAPLVYRLVALNPSKAWGTGKLAQLAEKPTSDHALAQELSALLLRPWKDDPIRAHVLLEQGLLDTENPRTRTRSPGWRRESFSKGDCAGLPAATSSAAGRDGSGNTYARGETWGDVLLDGRGAVGETVLHLAFLLNTPACRRLIHFLVPYLANKKTYDLFGHKVIDQPTLPFPALSPSPSPRPHHHNKIPQGGRSRRHLPGPALLWRGGRALCDRTRGPADAQAAC